MILANDEIKELLKQYFYIEKTESTLASDTITIKNKDLVFTVVLEKHEIHVFVDYLQTSIFYTAPKNSDNCMKLVWFLEGFKK